MVLHEVKRWVAKSIKRLQTASITRQIAPNLAEMGGGGLPDDLNILLHQVTKRRRGGSQPRLPTHRAASLVTQQVEATESSVSDPLGYPVKCEASVKHNLHKIHLVSSHLQSLFGIIQEI